MATGNNNNQAVRSYSKQFRELLPTVFEAKSYFGDFFAGGLQALDGVKDNAVAFSVKTCDIPVVVQNYITDEDVAFGDGTGNSSRFGPRHEIIYVDTDVPYDWSWAIHEGLDRATVNNNMDDAVADRLDLQAQAKVAKFNAKHSAFISSKAGKVVPMNGMTEADVITLFNEMSSYFVNIHAVGQKLAKVNSTIWNILVDSGLTVKEKESSVNIDRNTFVSFKGFNVEELPDDAFQTGEVAVFYIANVGAAFTGINTARTIESEDFDGLALQGHGLAGEYILPDNEPAVAKATYGTTPSSEKKITSLVINSAVGVIDEANHTIAVGLATGTDVTALEPVIAVSTGATVSPASGVATNFTSPVTYTVTAEDGTTQAYVVTVTLS